MINRHRLRRLLAPTAGLRKSILAFAAGLLLFIMGFGVSFRLVLLPFLRGLNASLKSLLGRLVGPDDIEVAAHILALGLLLLGIYLLATSAQQLFRRLIEVRNPQLRSNTVADVYFRRAQLAQGPRIVALGGGTGLSTLLRGLKQHSSNITAIVTVTDDGGSSGRLRKDKNMIPPGDIRNCLVALADAEKAMTDLFQHRFKDDSGSLSGHSMGNLLIAALVDQSRGDFEQAIDAASNVLAIRGRVVPSTLDTVKLKAIMAGNEEIEGETAIVDSRLGIQRIFLEPATVTPHDAALEAIRTADIICIGPGSIFTSVIPNLLVPGIAQALRNSEAAKVYVCNVMTQPGESEDFSASQHVAAIATHVGEKVMDFVLINDGVPSETQLAKYRVSGQHLVTADADVIRAMGYRPVLANLMNDSDFVRHDPMRVAAKVLALIDK